MDLTEAEDMKNRWQEYTEELYKKIFMTLWSLTVKTMETVADFIFWGSKITAEDDCSHEIKRGLLLGRNVMT